MTKATFRSDINAASDGIQRAIAINEKHEAERLNLIAALNKAIVVIGMLMLFGVAFVWSLSEADRQFARQDLERQESRHAVAH